VNDGTPMSAMFKASSGGWGREYSRELSTKVSSASALVELGFRQAAWPGFGLHACSSNMAGCTKGTLRIGRAEVAPDGSGGAGARTDDESRPSVIYRASDEGPPRGPIAEALNARGLRTTSTAA